MHENAALERDCAYLQRRKAELELKIEELKNERAAPYAAVKRAKEEFKEKQAFMKARQREMEDLMLNFGLLWSKSNEHKMAFEGKGRFILETLSSIGLLRPW